MQCSSRSITFPQTWFDVNPLWPKDSKGEVKGILAEKRLLEETILGFRDLLNFQSSCCPSSWNCDWGPQIRWDPQTSDLQQPFTQISWVRPWMYWTQCVPGDFLLPFPTHNKWNAQSLKPRLTAINKFVDSSQKKSGRTTFVWHNSPFKLHLKESEHFIVRQRAEVWEENQKTFFSANGPSFEA